VGSCGGITLKPHGDAVMKKNCIPILRRQDRPTGTIRTFLRSGMDTLTMGSDLVEK
jgi:hypothetical protein